MITAVWCPREDQVLLIAGDGKHTLPVPSHDVPGLVEGLAEAFAVPRLARSLAGGARVDAPVLTAWNAV